MGLSKLANQRPEWAFISKQGGCCLPRWLLETGPSRSRGGRHCHAGWRRCWAAPLRPAPRGSKVSATWAHVQSCFRSLLPDASSRDNARHLCEPILVASGDPLQSDVQTLTARGAGASWSPRNGQNAAGDPSAAEVCLLSRHRGEFDLGLAFLPPGQEGAGAGCPTCPGRICCPRASVQKSPKPWVANPA